MPSLMVGEGGGAGPRLRRQHAVVDLAAETRSSCADPQELELVLANSRLEVDIEHLDGRRAVVPIRDAVGAAEDDDRRVLLARDLALRGEARAEQRAHDPVAEPRLREQEEVLRPTTEYAERRDHARLGGQEQRLARLEIGRASCRG